MRHILFDRNIPYGLRRLVVGHRIETTEERGWSTLVNGALIAEAEAAGMQVIVTADQSLRYQQNLSQRTIALVVLSTNAWPVVRRHAETIQRALDQAAPRSFQAVQLPRPRKRPSRDDAGAE